MVSWGDDKEVVNPWKTAPQVLMGSSSRQRKSLKRAPSFLAGKSSRHLRACSNAPTSRMFFRCARYCNSMDDIWCFPLPPRLPCTKDSDDQKHGPSSDIALGDKERWMRGLSDFWREGFFSLMPSWKRKGDTNSPHLGRARVWNVFNSIYWDLFPFFNCWPFMVKKLTIGPWDVAHLNSIILALGPLPCHSQRCQLQTPAHIYHSRCCIFWGNFY